MKNNDNVKRYMKNFTKKQMESMIDEKWDEMIEIHSAIVLKYGYEETYKEGPIPKCEMCGQKMYEKKRKWGLLKRIFGNGVRIQ